MSGDRLPTLVWLLLMAGVVAIALLFSPYSVPAGIFAGYVLGRIDAVPEPVAGTEAGKP